MGEVIAGFFVFMTKGQVEDTISKEVAKFYSKALGVGPETTRVYIVEDMVIIRLKGKLFPIEERLLEGKNGISLVKDIRKTLHEVLTNNLSKIVSDITKHSIVSAHSDISTKTGERLEVFVLDKNYEEEVEV